MGSLQGQIIVENISNSLPSWSFRIYITKFLKYLIRKKFNFAELFPKLTWTHNLPSPNFPSAYYTQFCYNADFENANLFQTQLMFQGTSWV